jgi:hypothetical protein
MVIETLYAIGGIVFLAIVALVIIPTIVLGIFDMPQHPEKYFDDEEEVFYIKHE